MTGRHLAALVVIALLSPVPGRSAEPAVAPADDPAASGAPGPDSAAGKLLLLEAKYGELKKIYARDAEELDDLKSRQAATRPVQDEEGATQPEIEALRGLLWAVEGQLKSMHLLRQQTEAQFDALAAQSEERAALGALAASDLQVCTAERNEKIAGLANDIAAARDQVAALLREQRRQQEIKTKLIRKIKDDTVLLATLQNRCLELELEIAALRESANRAGTVSLGAIPRR